MNGLETVAISCPGCGERIEILVDCSVAEQTYVEDCSVCCRPILLQINVDGSGIPRVSATGEDESGAL